MAPVRTAALGSSGRKHDATVVGEHTILRAKTSLSLSAAALLSVGCPPPALIDPLGHPVSRPMLVASIENGRIAIDSSAAGVRARLQGHRVVFLDVGLAAAAELVWESLEGQKP